MFRSPATLERFEQRRLKYLRVIYGVCVLIISFFILRYNFDYHLYAYNKVLLPVLALLILTPLIYRFTHSYKLAVAWLVVMISLAAAYFLYLAGGLKAPGIFWLTSLPITGGILYGRRGAILSALAMIAIFLTFLGLDQFTLIPNVVKDYDIYQQEKLAHLICFFSYSLLITFYFMKNADIANREIIHSKEELENFMRILVHDIANPIAFIQGGLEEFKCQDLSPEEKHFILHRMEKNADNLLAILHQVRQFKALHDGKVALTRQTIDLEQTLRHILETQAPRIQEKRLNIQTTFKQKNIHALGDEVIFQNIVLANIISNAIKFSQPYGEIHITVDIDNDQVCIRVQDHGIGIPSRLLPKIFSMTASTTRLGTSGEKGTGYGLPLAREYIRRMDGDISVKSCETAGPETSSGTLITLRLPQAPC